MSKYAPHGRSANHPRAAPSTVCQKCLGTGHFIFECKSTRPYVSRPSRTQQLENPRVLAKLKADGKPSVEVPEEFKTQAGTANKILESKEKERLKELKEKGDSSRKRTRRPSSASGSSSSSESSSSSSDSDSSSSDSDSGSSSGSSRRNKRRRRRSRSSSGSPSSSSGDDSDDSRGRRR